MEVKDVQELNVLLAEFQGLVLGDFFYVVSEKYMKKGIRNDYLMWYPKYLLYGTIGLFLI